MHNMSLNRSIAAKTQDENSEGIAIPVLILVGQSNVYAKHSSSTSSTSSSSGITGLSTTTPYNYATKSGAFLSKCNFTSNAAQSVFVARETLVELESENRFLHSVLGYL